MKEREEELVHAKLAAEQSVALKTMFLANMSHEIRTPLNSILGFANLLKDEVSGNNPEKYVGIICDSGKQLLHLIDYILDVSRLDAVEIQVNLSAVNISKLLKKTKDQYEGYLAEKNDGNIDFRFKMPEDEGELCISTDEHRLQQIINNLLSNAIKFTDEGHIEFGYEIRDKKDILFFVSDSGKGISLEHQESIFERFHQLYETSEDQDKVLRGTGLGLAIARGLTERLGGRIWVESEKNKGSVFY